MPGSAGPRPPGSLPPSPPSRPALESGLAEAGAAKEDLETKIVDLEKRLTEEREKVLLASLRSKEEEAISAKVENSIKDIQDKLRREKKEQQLEEEKRKAEARVAEIERRLGEEREAWVQTLKNQLGQRDQVAQEMEGHFASRLKDLEYRWAQEKAGLENAVRDREGDLSRLTQEFALKSERERAFWEDRVRSLSAERDKLEREFERANEKIHQEREHAQIERQTLRDETSRLQAALRLAEDRARAEKSTLKQELEATLNLAVQKAVIERETIQKQLERVEATLAASDKRLIEREAQIEALRGQLGTVQVQLDRTQALYREVDRGSGTAQAELERAKEEMIRLREENLRLRANFEGRAGETATLAQRLESSERALASARQAVADLESDRTNLKREADEVRSLFKTSLAEKEGQFAREKEQWTKVSDEAKRESVLAQDELKRIDAEYRRLQERLVRMEAIEAEAAGLRSARAELESRVRTLESTAEDRLRALQRSQRELETATDSLVKSNRDAEAEKLRFESGFAALESQKRALETQIFSLESSLRENADQIERLTKDLLSAREGLDESRRAHEAEVRRLNIESDERMRTLQRRLDWYDSNADREYQAAREKARTEVESLRVERDESVRRLATISKEVEDGKAVIDELRTAKDAVEARRIELEEILERTRADAVRAKAASDSQVKRAEIEAKALEDRIESLAHGKRELEDRLRGRDADFENERTEKLGMASDLEDARAKLSTVSEALEVERQRAMQARAQLDQYKTLLKGQSIEDIEELRAELEQNRKKIGVLQQGLQEYEKQQAVFAQKEHSLRELLDEKSATISDLKGRLSDLERSLRSVNEEKKQLAADVEKKIASARSDKDATEIALREEVQALKRNLVAAESQKNAAEIALEKRIHALKAQMDDAEAAFERKSRDARADHQKELANALFTQKENLEKRFEATLAERDAAAKGLEKRLEEAVAEKEKAEISFEQRLSAARAEREAAEKDFEKRLAESLRDAESRARMEIPQGPDAATIENDVRQRVESEFLEQMREHESSFETKLKKAKEEAKKDADRLRWENESLKDEVRKVREARNQIEREAQELLQQAEAHYRKELDRHTTELIEKINRDRGIFSTIGRFLDKPIIDTTRGKDAKDKAA